MDIPLYDCYYNPYQLSLSIPLFDESITHDAHVYCVMFLTIKRKAVSCHVAPNYSRCIAHCSPCPPTRGTWGGCFKKKDLGSSTVESLDEAWGWSGLNESCDGTAGQRLSPLLGSCCGASCSASCWSCSGHWMDRTPLKTNKFHHNSTKSCHVWLTS